MPSMLVTGIALMPVILGRSPRWLHQTYSTCSGAWWRNGGADLVEAVDKRESARRTLAEAGADHGPVMSPKIFFKGPELNLGE